MFRWRTHSNLYIDYENVPASLVQSGLPNVLDWLEDGQFDEGRRKRRIVERRVYWNSSQAHHHQHFEASGFTPVLCEKHSGLKNGADIKMVMDVLESALSAKAADEYILISSDSDFVPLLQRLKTLGKESVVVVDEKKPTIHTSFNYHADHVITHREFKEGQTYVRSRGWCFGFTRKGDTTTGQPGVPKQPARPPKVVTDPLVEAERRVIQLISSQPKQMTSHRKIKAALRNVKGLNTMPTKDKSVPLWLGYDSYDKLMAELAKRSGKIELRKAGDSVNAVYIPDEAKT